MNRRLSRFVLIGILLLSALVTMQLPGDVSNSGALAQGSGCGAGESAPDAALATPQSEIHPWVESRSESVVADDEGGLTETKTLVVILPAGGDFTPGPMTGDAVIRIDSGTVMLEACGDKSLAVHDGQTGEIQVVAPGTPIEVAAGSSIFVPAGGSYSLSTEGAPATFTLTAMGTFMLRVLCGGAGC
jgi:hypothetical protein